jgi:lipoyl(octanoyl) transferase
MNELLVADIGVVGYAAALEMQRDLAKRRISGDVSEDVLVLVEHPPVVTLGRTAKAANLTASPSLLSARGVELFEVERGGDVTFHGPGQIVGYPIVDLKRHRKDLHWYLRQVEQALIDSLGAIGISAGRVEKQTGVWVGLSPDSQFLIPDSRARKIASIGVHARDWVTWHGFALNVNTDLRYFELMVPCGIAGVDMTSVARELDRGSVDMNAVKATVAARFAATFGLVERLVAHNEFWPVSDAVAAARSAPFDVHHEED